MESLQPKGSNPFVSGILGGTKPEVARKIIGQLSNPQAAEKSGSIFAKVLGRGSAPEEKQVKELESKIRQLGSEKSNLVKYKSEEQFSRADTGGENPVSRGFKDQAREASAHIEQLESEIQKLSESTSFKTVFLKETIAKELNNADQEIGKLSEEIKRLNGDVAELKRISQAKGTELDGQIQSFTGRTKETFKEAKEYVSNQVDLLRGTEFQNKIEEMQRKLDQAESMVNAWKA